MCVYLLRIRHRISDSPDTLVVKPRLLVDMAAPAARKRGASKGGDSSLSLLLFAGLGVAAAIVAAALSPFPKPAAWDATASSFTLSDGRSLAYQVSGSADGNFTLLYLPRCAIAGSRNFTFGANCEGETP